MELALSLPSVTPLSPSCVTPQALAGDQPTAQPPLRAQQLAPPYTYAQGGQQTWVRPQLPHSGSPGPRGRLGAGQWGVL